MWRAGAARAARSARCKARWRALRVVAFWVRCRFTWDRRGGLPHPLRVSAYERSAGWLDPEALSAVCRSMCKAMPRRATASIGDQNHLGHGLRAVEFITKMNAFQLRNKIGGLAVRAGKSRLAFAGFFDFEAQCGGFGFGFGLGSPQKLSERRFQIHGGLYRGCFHRFQR